MEYAEELKEMTWSFSRVHSYEQCPYEFYLNYLFRDENGNRIYEGEDNFYGAYGSFCHSLLEQILSQKISIDDAYIKYQEEYDDALSQFNVRETIIDKYFYLGLDYFGHLSFDWLKDYDVLGIEKRINFKIDAYQFVGYIDLLVREKKTGDIIVIDHKSSEYPLGKRGAVKKTKQESYDSYKKQLYLYSKAVIDEYGQAPKMLVWNYYKEQKWLEIPFAKDEYEEALMWATDTIHRIERDTEFVSHMEHFYCTQLCRFRRETHTCEYADGGF